MMKCIHFRCTEQWFGRGCELECDHGHIKRNITDTCVCDPGWSGKSCSAECSFHGKVYYDEVHQVDRCDCDPAWKGPVCDIPGCPGKPEDCSGHGYCNKGTSTCDCFDGWTGNVDIMLNGCDIPDCPGRPDCSNHGTCDASFTTPRCVDCHDGYMGPACDDPCTFGKQTPMNSGFCLCDSCHTGKGCNSECNDGGTCVNGTCVCNDQWTGPKCTIPGCPGMCSGHGTCNSGDHICFCTPGNV